MLKKYTTSKLHKYNSIVYTVEPVRTNLKLNKKVRNKYYIEVLIYLTFICIFSACPSFCQHFIKKNTDKC